MKSLEVNEGCAQGNCAKLLELHWLVKEDPALQNLSEEAEEMLKDDLLTMQDLKKTGVHPTNKGCALDYRAEICELNDTVSSLLAHSLTPLIRFAHLHNALVPPQSHFL